MAVIPLRPDQPAKPPPEPLRRLIVSKIEGRAVTAPARRS